MNLADYTPDEAQDQYRVFIDLHTLLIKNQNDLQATVDYLRLPKESVQPSPLELRKVKNALHGLNRLTISIYDEITGILVTEGAPYFEIDMWHWQNKVPLENWDTIARARRQIVEKLEYLTPANMRSESREHLSNYLDIILNMIERISESYEKFLTRFEERIYSKPEDEDEDFA